MRTLLGLTVTGLLAFGTANAVPMHVDPAAAGSSVDAYITNSACIDCSVDATLSADLDAAEAWLDVGDSFEFDFFDLTVGGLIGGAEVVVEATLALDSPKDTAAILS